MLPSAKTRFTCVCGAGLRAGRTETEARSETGAAATALAVMMYGLASTLKGPATSAVAVNVPWTFLGSRHESAQVPPHPYWKLKVRSYLPSSLLKWSFGACGRAPLRLNATLSPSCPSRLYLKL